MRRPLKHFGAKAFFEVTFSVRMDDGSVRFWDIGFSIMIMGPAKGGIRFHPLVNLQEVKALEL